MFGVNGIGGIPEPANAQEGGARVRKADAARDQSKDEIAISSEAQAAARASQAVHKAELRAQKIARAKENIAQGTYRVQDVVRQVAAVISQYIPGE